MKIIIAEDESLLRKELANELTSISYVEEIVECSSISELKKAIETRHFDLAILDLEINEGTTLDLIEQSGPFDFELIITSSHEQYGVRAVNIGAQHYLLKPINYAHLISHIDLIQTKLYFDKPGIIRKLERIAVRSTNTIEMIDLSEILYLQSDGNYTTFHLTQHTVVTSKPIKFYETLLKHSKFLRVHQSYLVNLSKVIKYNLNGSIILNNRKELQVSRRKREAVIEALT